MLLKIRQKKQRNKLKMWMNETKIAQKLKIALFTEEDNHMVDWTLEDGDRESERH